MTPRVDRPVLPPSAYDRPIESWAGTFREWGLPAFRSAQLVRWLHLPAETFDTMTDLPASLRSRLATEFRDLAGTAVVEEEGRADVGTSKLLLRLGDGEHVESVLIPARDRMTVCVSSQVGCAFHCAFCASGAMGFTRHLTRGEIVAQALRAAQRLGRRPDNVVFMGIGEPLDNYDEVLGAIRTLNHPEGLGIGARRITVSTCGVVPGIRRLAGEGLQIELSVSLHAPTDEQRSELMPVNRSWPIAELLRACADYTSATDRIVTFEYTLVRGFNDSPRDAKALVSLLRGLKCRVNLIPLNPTRHFPGETPPESTLYGFRDFLMASRLNATLRVSRGGGIDAACGQLRLRRLGSAVSSAHRAQP